MTINSNGNLNGHVNGNAHANGNGHAPGGPPLEVAVVGGGIIGVMTALGLHRRGIKATIYERSSTWTEVSAGFAFTEAAREWMRQLNPDVLDILGRISQKTDANSSNSYWDGYTARTRADAEDESKSLLFRTPNNKLLFWGCVRSQLLKEMAALLPQDSFHFRKNLADYEDDVNSDKVVLHFEDGTTAKADVVLGCDGVHSNTRKVMLGRDDPAARPGYTHNVTYRTMVPIDVGVAAMGEKCAQGGTMHCGPNACLLTYPVNSGKLLNIAIFAYDAKDFPNPDRMTAEADRSEIRDMFRDWCPHAADVWKQYPEKTTKWGMYDMTDNPPRTYARGRVCIVGDAAHASTPFLGVGACTGVEDALVVCKLLEPVQQSFLSLRGEEEEGGAAATTAGADAAAAQLREALQAYSRARLERGQWVPRESAAIGRMYHWRDGRDPKGLQEQLAGTWDRCY
ncbi:putative salicylate hydroxylase [Xylariaceae sp. FL0804]|nr:putative salicylate hydroxylase [Xylariaceae sp. FL0804]